MNKYKIYYSLCGCITVNAKDEDEAIDFLSNVDGDDFIDNIYDTVITKTEKIEEGDLDNEKI